MKLAILTLDFAPGLGGVQTYLYEIAKWLSEKHDVTVVTPVTGDIAGPAPFHRITPKRADAYGFRGALRQVQPDRILVGHAHPQLLLAASLYSSYATLCHGNDYLAAQRQWHRPLFNRLLNRSRPLITNTHANARRLQGLGLQEAVVIHPGTDPQRFHPPPQSAAFPPILLTVSRLVPRKGIDLVMECLPALMPEYPQLRYFIAGDGPDRERLQTLADTYDLTASVRFLGRVEEEIFPQIYRQAHVFVMPAREELEAASLEGFGIVYLEASASGLPVIAGRSGGAVEAVRDGETGFLVEPHDAAALAVVLSHLLGDVELRQRLGRNGRAWVQNTMNWQRAASEMASALLLNEK